MALMIEKLDTATAVAAAGFHIPQGDLVGITSAEMTTATPDSKIAMALMEAIYSGVTALTNKLGVSVAKAAPAGAGNDLVNQNYSAVFTNLIDLRDLTVGVVPLNGASFGVVEIQDLFPNASAVDPADTPGKGIVIPNTALADYGSGTAPADVDEDARQWLQALWFSLVDELAVGNGVVSRARSAISAGTIPANFTGTGAISGIDANDLPYLALYTVSYNATIRLVLDQATQTFDVDLD